MDAPKTSPYVFLSENYRDSRVYREWTKALDDYKIVWTDQTSVLSDTPYLYLEELDLDLHLIGPHQPPKWLSDALQEPTKWDASSLWGDHQGHFGFVGCADHTGNLLWCQICSKAFVCSQEEGVCPVCGFEQTFLTESRVLTWFGFQAAVNFRPFAIKRTSVEKSHEPAVVQRTRLLRETQTDKLGLDPTSLEHDLFDEMDAMQAEKREEGAWSRLRESLSGKARSHGWPTQKAVEDLADLYPNFTEVCEFVLAEIALAPYRRVGMVRLPNILVIGGPSSGKSSFCQRLAQIVVGTDWERIDLGQSPSYFELTGSDSGYQRAKEGRVLRLLASRDATGPVRNPVLILDELDKVREAAQHTPLPALLSLLEKRDAKRFRDAFFGVPVDASGIQFLATANDRYEIAAPLLSRFEVFHIADYTTKEFVDVVVPNLYREWINEFHEGSFPASIPHPLRRFIAEQADFVARRVTAVFVRLARRGTLGFRPVPTWESLADLGRDE